MQKQAVTARCPQAAQFVFILACRKHLFGPCLVFQSPRVCLLNLLSFFILSNRAYLIWFSLGSFVSKINREALIKFDTCASDVV